MRAWEAKNLRLTFRARMHIGENWVGYRKRTAHSLRTKWKKMGLPLLVEKIVVKIWMTINWAFYGGEVPFMTALRSILGWRTPTWWRNKSAWDIATDGTNVTRWKHKFGFHNRGVQRDTPMVKFGGRREKLDTAYGTWTTPHGRRDGPSTRDDETCREKKNSTRRCDDEEAKRPGTTGTREARRRHKLILEIRGDSKTMVDWVNGHAKLKMKESTIATAQNLLRELWSREVGSRQRVTDWAVHIFREHNKEADSWAGERRPRSRRRMGGHRERCLV